MASAFSRTPHKRYQISATFPITALCRRHSGRSCPVGRSICFISLRYALHRSFQLSDLNEPDANWTITLQPTALLTFLHALVRSRLNALTLEQLFISRILLVELLTRAAENCMNKVEKPSEIIVGANAQLVTENAAVMQYLRGSLGNKSA